MTFDLLVVQFRDGLRRISHRFSPFRLVFVLIGLVGTTRDPLLKPLRSSLSAISEHFFFFFFFFFLLSGYNEFIFAVEWIAPLLNWLSVQFQGSLNFFYSSSALTFPQIELFAIRIEVWIEFDRLKPLLEFKSINRIKWIFFYSKNI